jgi:hypothetical protein
MKHIKLFESHSNCDRLRSEEKIKEELEDYFLELVDNGYRTGFSHNNDYSITVFNLYKSKVDFNGLSKSIDSDTSGSEWCKILQSDTQKIASIQKRISSLGVENLISKVKFHVYTFYDTVVENNIKSAVEPGIIEYSSILNGDIIYRNMDNKLNELRRNIEDLEIRKFNYLHRPFQYYFDIQIQQEIDYGTKDASSVLFKNSL